MEIDFEYLENHKLIDLIGIKVFKCIRGWSSPNEYEICDIKILEYEYLIILSGYNVHVRKLNIRNYNDLDCKLFTDKGEALAYLEFLNGE